MELKDFISGTLEQICFGIREAQHSTRKVLGGAAIAPAYVGGKPVYEKESMINFDIAITVSSDNKLKTEGKVGIAVVGGAVEGELNSSTQNVHRISFSVPFHPAALQAEKETE